MADNDVSFRQCAIIEFLFKEEIPAADIHHRFKRVYGDVCTGASSVRQWVKHFNTSRPRGVLILRDLSRQLSGWRISTSRFS